DQRHSQNAAGIVAHLVDRPGDLDATALASAARMDLRLHDPCAAAQPGGSLYRLVDGKTWNSARRCHAVFAQHFLPLILVNIHDLPYRYSKIHLPAVACECQTMRL